MRLQTKRTATIAWCPITSPIYLVAGTVAGALDDSFSTNAELEILELQCGFAQNEIVSKVSIPAPARFQRVAWTAKSGGDNIGVIATGMENGHLDLWDASRLLAGEGENARIIHHEQHKGPIRGLDFNPIQDNLLASGAQDGEVFIWDLTNPAKSYLPGTKSQKITDISCLSWNRQVPHILASGSVNGTTVIWDLKNKREVISLTPAVRTAGPCTAVAWHPEISTQIITAYEDHPEIFVWDLRNARAPERVLTGHEKGVLALSWNHRDPSILLSSSKDNRTLAWNPTTSELLGQFSSSQNWVFDVQFAPKNPVLLATASYDGDITIESLAPSPIAESVVEKPAAHSADPFANIQEPSHPKLCLPHAPKWLKRPVSSTFGFGGKLISVDPSSRNVTVRRVVIETDLLPLVEKFEAVTESADFASFCEDKAKNAANHEDRLQWEAMGALMDAQGRNARLLGLFGFDKETIAEKLAHLVSSEDATSAATKETEEAAQPSTDEGSEAASDLFSGEGSGAFEVSGELDHFPAQASAPVVTATPFKIFTHDAASSEIDRAVTQAILVSDFKLAVDVCLSAGRTTDALLIAAAGGPDLLSSTQQTVLQGLQKEGQPAYARLLISVLEQNLSDIIQHADLADWKAIIAAICSFASEKDFASQCNLLAERLEQAEMSNEAIVVYICAGNVPKVVELLTSGETAHLPEAEHSAALHGFIEKITLLRYVNDVRGISSTMSAALLSKYGHYAELLAANGKLAVALKYLSLATSDPSQMSEELSALADRLSHAQLSSAKQSYQPVAQQQQYGYAQQPQQVQAGGYMQPQQPAMAYQQPTTQYAPQTFQQQPVGYYTSPQRQQQPLPGLGPAAPLQQPAMSAYTPASAAPWSAPAPVIPSPAVALASASRPPVAPQTAGAPAPAVAAAAGGAPKSGWNDAPYVEPKAKMAPAAAPPVSQPITPLTPAAPTKAPLAPPPTSIARPQSRPPPPTTMAPPNPVPIPSPNPVMQAATQPLGQQPYMQPQPPVMGAPHPGGFIPQPGVQPVMPLQPQQPMMGGAPGPAMAPPARPRTSSLPQAQRAPEKKPAPPKKTAPTGDRSRIKPEHMPIMNTLNGCVARAEAASQSPSRQLKEAKNRVELMLDKLNDGQISENLCGLLLELCRALDMRNYEGALKVQIDIITRHTDEAENWAVGIKWLIEILRMLP